MLAALLGLGKDKITFDYALKLNGTIKIIGCIQPFNKYLKPKNICKHQHINMVYPFQRYFFCKNQAFFISCRYAGPKYKFPFNWILLFATWPLGTFLMGSLTIYNTALITLCNNFLCIIIERNHDSVFFQM